MTTRKNVVVDVVFLFVCFCCRSFFFFFFFFFVVVVLFVCLFFGVFFGLVFFVCLFVFRYSVFTPQPFYNTIVGVQNINRVSYTTVV